MTYRSGSHVLVVKNYKVRRMLGKILLTGTTVAILGLILLLNLTTPTMAGPGGILAVFILSYMIALGLITFTIHGVSRLLVKVTTGMVTKRPLHVVSIRHSYYFASLIALAPVMLLGMQSVGGVGWYELLLIIFFVAIGCVYISRRML